MRSARRSFRVWPSTSPLALAPGKWSLCRAFPTLLAVVVCALACAPSPEAIAKSGQASSERTPIVERPYEIVARYPHDPAAYTQGLLWWRGQIYESRGTYGGSGLRVYDPVSGVVSGSVDLPDDIFAEGLARVGERLVQLTWKQGAAYIYDLDSLERLGEFGYAGEGWGLAGDESALYMSNGTPFVSVRDPQSFEERRLLRVTRDALPLDRLNELELIGGVLYANVYMTDEIVGIDPETGVVVESIDLNGLLTDSERRSAEVLNGIAYVAERGTLLVTGKYWPAVFEIRLLDE